MLPFTRYPSLRTYLKLVRDVVFQQGAAEALPPLTLVMGNPSADLDSFISAIVFSYFHNHAAKAGDRVFIPLLNMPKTPSTDLWRLRPEFGVALRSATTITGQAVVLEQAQDQEKDLLNQTLTIKDLLDSPSTRPDLKRVFLPIDQPVTQPIILVDHNAPSITIPHVTSSSITSQLSLQGCIDHHIDEHTIPATATPRIITTGIGSCTTLVINHLRQTALYPRTTLDDTTQTAAVHQLSRLALAPILVDTHNLKASGDKCSDLDRAAVLALELEVGGSPSLYGVKSSWDRDAFYEPIVAAKAASLDRLSAREMLERDYKAWVEGEVEIGIASLVRPVGWLVERVGGAAELAGEMGRFAKEMQEEQMVVGVGFGLLVLLTPGDGRGKEIVMVAFSEMAERVFAEFEEMGREELGLKDWDAEGSEGVLRAWREVLGERRVKVWWMTRREKTRKQGAPIVRAAVAAVQEVER